MRQHLILAFDHVTQAGGSDAPERRTDRCFLQSSDQGRDTLRLHNVRLTLGPTGEPLRLVGARRLQLRRPGDASAAAARGRDRAQGAARCSVCGARTQGAMFPSGRRAPMTRIFTARYHSRGGWIDSVKTQTDEAPSR